LVFSDNTVEGDEISVDKKVRELSKKNMSVEHSGPQVNSFDAAYMKIPV